MFYYQNVKDATSQMYIISIQHHNFGPEVEGIYHMDMEYTMNGGHIPRMYSQSIQSKSLLKSSLLVLNKALQVQYQPYDTIFVLVSLSSYTKSRIFKTSKK